MSVYLNGRSVVGAQPSVSLVVMTAHVQTVFDFAAHFPFESYREICFGLLGIPNPVFNFLSCQSIPQYYSINN